MNYYDMVFGKVLMLLFQVLSSLSYDARFQYQRQHELHTGGGWYGQPGAGPQFSLGAARPNTTWCKQYRNTFRRLFSTIWLGFEWNDGHDRKRSLQIPGPELSDYPGVNHVNNKGKWPGKSISLLRLDFTLGKKINSKLAFKVNAQYTAAKDWVATDYQTRIIWVRNTPT